LFGYGSAIVCAGIFGLGVIILLPKLGIVIRFPPAASSPSDRLPSLLRSCTSRQATQTAQSARAGKGGGQVGWRQFICQRPVRFNRCAGLFRHRLSDLPAVVIGIRREHLTSGSAGQR